MKNCQKLIVGMLVVILLMGMGIVASAKQVNVPLTLDDAIGFALESSIDYQIALLNWSNTEIDQKIQSLQPVQIEEDKLKMELAARQAQGALSTTQANVIFAVTQDYYALSRQERQLQIAENQLALAQHDLNLVSRRVSMGELPERELAKEQNRFNAVEASVATSKRNYANAVDNFFFLLGMNKQWESVNLVSEVPVPEFDLSLAASQELAQQNNQAIWERKINFRLTQITLQKVMAQDPAPLVLQKAENNYLINRLNAVKAERSFDQRLVTDWYGLQDAKRLLDAANVDYNLARDDYRLKTTQLEAGLITRNQLLQSENSYLMAVNSLNERSVNYYMAVLRYQRELGVLSFE